MSWNDYRERREVLDTVLERAQLDPTAALDLTGLDVDRLFGSADNLLLALEHRWATQLAARLDQAIHDGIPARVAREELSADMPILRALLDAAGRNSHQLRNVQRNEQRMVAAHNDVQFNAGLGWAIA